MVGNGSLPPLRFYLHVKRIKRCDTVAGYATYIPGDPTVHVADLDIIEPEFRVMKKPEQQFPAFSQISALHPVYICIECDFIPPPYRNATLKFHPCILYTSHQILPYQALGLLPG